ncbi:ATP-binding protein [Streptomyces sp. KLMMK]|uniref:ATP-binding protein n=1 Tax=Streptomyces sp. KLMMK TaxID=3109353 RepID=UPI00300923AA
MWRRVLTVPLVPEAVRQARHDTTTALSEYGLRPDSAFAGAALPAVSELVANAVRHAADQSPTADVTIAAGDGQLVVGVADQAPRLPVPSPAGVGDGLRTVADLAAAYGGTLTVEPAVHGCGILSCCTGVRSAGRSKWSCRRRRHPAALCSCRTAPRSARR